MYESGVTQFREKWAESGYQLPFSTPTTIDQRNGPLPIRIVKGGWNFIRSHVMDLSISIMGLGSNDPKTPIDAIGGTIGSLDLITATQGEGKNQVKITVDNVMGLASFTRFPGTDITVMDNENREAPRPWGGTITQEFYWFETLPERGKGAHKLVKEMMR